MSQFIQLPDTLSVDSRLTIGSAKKIEIRKGGQNNTIQRTTATSVSNNQLVFNVQLNNAANTIIDPYMYVEVPISVTVTASGLTGANTVPVYLADNFSLRQYPLASVTSVAQVQINNQSSTSNPSQFIHQLSQFQDFINGDDQAAVQSIAPIMPDQAPQYNTLAGSSKSPLLSYTSGGEHYSCPRGEFNSLFTTTTGTTATWVFTTTIREPIFNPLVDYDPLKKREGLAYVSLFNVQLTFLSNLSRMFALDLVSCPAITGISVSITSASLVQTWLTAPQSMKMPDVALRSFNTLICNQTTQASFSASEQRVIQSQSYSMNQIPKKIWIFVADAQTDISAGYAKSDFCFSIEQVTVLFNNRAGLLSNMNSADLFNACMAEEGNKMTYVQSRKFTGAVLCFDPAKLFSLLDNEAPGMLGNYQLQIQVQCTNISTSSVTPNIWVVWAMDTILSTDSHSVSNLVQGFLRPEDVAAANGLPAHSSLFAETDLYGGSLWDDIKSFGQKALGFVKDNKLISKGLPLLSSFFPEAAPIIAPLGALAASQGYGKTSRRQMKQRALRY
jgi:hypothetical protein